MDIKSVVAHLAANCDQRERLVRSVPGILDDYVVSEEGELLTKAEADRVYAIKFFKDGLDYVCARVK